jgi:predicted ester cyclase
VILCGVGLLADVHWLQLGEYTVLLFYEFDRDGPIIADLPAKFITCFDARFTPDGGWNCDRVALVHRRFVLDLLRHTWMFAAFTKIIYHQISQPRDGDPAVLDEICSPAFAMHRSDGETLDREELKEVVQTREAGDSLVSDFEVEVEDVVVEDDTVASRATLRGTADSPLEDVADYEPTGERVAYAGTSFMRVEDGEFVEEWQFVDRYDLYETLGLIDGPGQP